MELKPVENSGHCQLAPLKSLSNSGTHFNWYIALVQDKVVIQDSEYAKRRLLTCALICFVIAAVSASAANAGTLFGYGSYEGSSDVEVWSINPATGQTHVLATTTAASVFEGTYAAYDPANQTLIFAGPLSPGGTALYSTNLTTGVTASVAGSPAVSDVQIFFDTDNGTLYGYGSYNGSSSTEVWSINPATGQTSVVATSIACNPFEGAYAAFDPMNDLLYIAGLTSPCTALCETNLTTGVTTSIAGSPAVSDSQIFFDTDNGTLYGYGSYNGSSSTEVWSINPATGQTSVVATSIACNPFEGAYAAFDPANGLLYIAGLTSPGTALCETNLTTGVTTSIAGSYAVSDSQLFFAADAVSSTSEVSTLFLAVGGLGWLAGMRRFRRRIQVAS